MRSIGINHHQTPPSATISNKLHHAPPSVRGLQRHLPNQNVRTKPMALTTSHVVVLAVAPPAGNISVLIATGAGFAFLYWIANFVVPAMVMKDLESDDADKDQNYN